MLRDLRWVTLAETISRISSLVTVSLLTNALLPAQYGIYRSVFLATGILLFGQSLSSIGFLVQKRLPELEYKPVQGSIITAAVSIHLLLVVFAVLGLFVANFFSLFTLISDGLQQVVSEYPYLIAVLVVTQGMTTGLFPVLRGIGAFFIFSILKLVRELIILSAILALFLMNNLTLLNAVFIYAIAETVILLVTTTILLRSELLTLPDYGVFKTQFYSTSLPLVPRAFVKFVGGKTPDMLILAVLGEVVFASWTVLFAFTNVFQLLSKPFSQMLIPKISDRVNDGQSLDRLVVKYYKTMTLLCVPLVLGGALVGPDLIRYFFGGGYVIPVNTMTVFLFAFCLQNIDSLGGSMFIGTGQSGRDTIRFTLSIAVRLVFVILGTVVFESLLIIGIGYVLENVVRFTISIRYQITVVSFPRIQITQLMLYIGILALMSLTVMVSKNFTHNLPSILLTVGVGSGVYFAGLLLSGLVSNDDLELISRFFLG